MGCGGCGGCGGDGVDCFLSAGQYDTLNVWTVTTSDDHVVTEIIHDQDDLCISVIFAQFSTGLLFSQIRQRIDFRGEMGCRCTAGLEKIWREEGERGQRSSFVGSSCWQPRTIQVSELSLHGWNQNWILLFDRCNGIHSRKHARRSEL